MSFYSRLEEVMKEKNVRRKELVNALGLSDANFSMWKKGFTPRDQTAIKLAEYLGVSVSYLKGYTDDKTPEVNVTKPIVYDTMKARAIPVFNGLPDSDDIFQEFKYMDDEIPCSDKIKGIDGLFAIYATSDTMKPIVNVGDLLIAQQTDFCNNGDMCIYRLFGDTGIRWLHETETEISLYPENLFDENNNFKGYRIISIPKDKLDEYDFSIVGKVLEVRKFQTYLYKAELI